IVRDTGAIHRDEALDGLGVEQAFAHGRVDYARGYGIYRDPASRDLEGKSLGSGVERAFRGGVVDLSLVADQSGNGGHVHDAPPPGTDHRHQDVARDVEESVYRYVDDPVPLF